MLSRKTPRLFGLALALALGTALPAQRGGGIRGPRTAPAGGTMTIEVATNDTVIHVVDAATGEGTSHPVAGGKVTRVPVPALPAGSVILVSVGRGLRARVIAIEIVQG